jgi:hypothetical protein
MLLDIEVASEGSATIIRQLLTQAVGFRHQADAALDRGASELDLPDIVLGRTIPAATGSFSPDF